MLKKCEVIAVFACLQQWSQVRRHQLKYFAIKTMESIEVTTSNPDPANHTVITREYICLYPALRHFYNISIIGSPVYAKFRWNKVTRNNLGVWEYYAICIINAKKKQMDHISCYYVSFFEICHLKVLFSWLSGSTRVSFNSSVSHELKAPLKTTI